MGVKWPRLYPKMCHISCCLDINLCWVQFVIHSRPNIGFLRTQFWISGCSSSSSRSSWCLVSLPRTNSAIWWLTATTWTETVFFSRTGRYLEQEQWNPSVLSYWGGKEKIDRSAFALNCGFVPFACDTIHHGPKAFHHSIRHFVVP